MSFKRISAAIALLALLSTTRIFMGVSFAEPGSSGSGESVATMPQQLTGVLTVQGNKEIAINGSSAISGFTIVSGASISTPAGVGATINLGSLGSLDIGPGSELTLEFAAGRVRILLGTGCVMLRTNKGTAGEIDNAKGVVGKTNSQNGGAVDACPPAGGTSTSTAGGAGGGTGGGGVGTAALFAIIVGGAGAIAIPLALRGGNPSPSR